MGALGRCATVQQPRGEVGCCWMVLLPGQLKLIAFRLGVEDTVGGRLR